MKLTRAWETEGAGWPEEIEVKVLPALQAQIDEATKYMETHLQVSSMSLRDTALLIEAADDEKLQEACRYDCSYVEVYAGGGWYWKIQSKYDSSVQGEYAPEGY